MLRNRKGISTVIAIAAIVLIIFGCVGTYYMYRMLQVSEDERVTEVFYGTVTITVGESNALDSSASVSTTSDSYVAYHTKGQSLSEATKSDFIGGSTFTVGTAKDISIEKEDEGKLWVKAYTGTDYFLHLADTIEANPRIKSDAYKFIDVDNDNRLEVVFEIDLSDISEPLPVTKPTMDLTIMVIQEDTSVAFNSPADITSIGTGTKTGTIEWGITGCSEKYGFALARIYITQNRTNEDYMIVSAVDVEGIDVFSGSAITYDSGSKTWSVDIDIDDYREVVGAHQMLRRLGGSSTFDITVSYETYFTASGSGHAVTVTVYAQTIGADEAVDTAISDAVDLAG